MSSPEVQKSNTLATSALASIYEDADVIKKFPICRSS